MGMGELTKGVRYCQLLTSSWSVSDSVFRSRSTKEISTIRAAPAAIKVHPNTVCTCVLNSSPCGCALIAHPVRMITSAGSRLRFGRPSLFLLSHTPSKPAHHHTMPMLVCCRSFFTHAVPQRCSVNVFTHPHAAISNESKNSWLRPVRASHCWPTSSRIVRMIPYPMKALPMMKCARHWPR